MEGGWRWSTLVGVVMLVAVGGCAERQPVRTGLIAKEPPSRSVYIQQAMERRDIVPGMTRDDVYAAIGDPLPLQREGTTFGFPDVRAYTVFPYGEPDTVWVVYDGNGTVVIVER